MRNARSRQIYVFERVHVLGGGLVLAPLAPTPLPPLLLLLLLVNLFVHLRV